jgi:hypothetical protein
MASKKLFTLILIFSFVLPKNLQSLKFSPGSMKAARQSFMTMEIQVRESVSQEEEFQRRRQHFESGRQLLLDKAVPFEPEELLRDDWPRKLKPALDRMPEMHDVRYETKPLHGAYFADTLYLPETVILVENTIIVANNLVFEGHDPVIRGPHDLHIFRTQPVAVLGITLAQALQKKAGMLNASFHGNPGLPPFALLRDLDQKVKHVTFDISALPPRSSRLEHKARFSIQTISLSANNVQTTDTSGGTGQTGTPGISPGPAPSAQGIPAKAGGGSCVQVNGTDGDPGFNAPDGTMGGQGGEGGRGNDASNQLNDFVADGDLTQYSYVANGGQGGKGGPGGRGQMGGTAGQGGAGGDGFNCNCTLGVGGQGGRGGIPGKGGRGGPGGPGGSGGSGGNINVSIPWNHPGVSTSVVGGQPGVGGDPGQPGLSGGPGPGGAGGSGALGCTQKAADGAIGGPGPVVQDGLPGDPGINGTVPGSAGTANVTRRTQTVGGGCGAACLPNPCLNSVVVGPLGNFNAPGCSPVILDTKGTGFKLTSASAGVLFDITGSGSPVKLAWTDPGSGNAFLVLDRNHNGTIDNGTELFGNFTPQPSSPTPNGFAALAEFDKPENGGNGDGVIDEHDSVYFQLQLWIDENHDGISQPNELHSLLEMGVRRIQLDYHETKRTDEFGNVFRFKAGVDDLKGANLGRSAYDVFLTTAQ